ncbi:rhamnulose-1-phosphate aldolase [Dysgonomonas sp. ZJ709]|uniref:rhamnulose-1-phosphate aldolase n=1 Tax=Dysgonomonas sp. ZJ709 TaxID=2709797 RepID=UPI0013EA62E5|nr:rhamnulose-1-phosphate aldolase [Dysgonomonas sp. ZJ709]
MKLSINNKLQAQLDEVAEIAGYLWEKGWAERNAGNISINVSEFIGDENRNLSAQSKYPLPRNMKELAGDFFFVTGTGKRMRDVAKCPLSNGSIVRVSQDGDSYDVISEENVKPTSELASHFSILASFKKKGSNNRLVLHTHPTDLIAMSHIPELKNEKALNELLWGMHPETFIVVPRGIGLVPYEVPGTLAIADLTLPTLDRHDIVIWEKHGVFAVGENLTDTFDLIDTLSKSAQIYAFARTCGYTPEGLTKEQIQGLIEPFGIKL